MTTLQSAPAYTGRGPVRASERALAPDLARGFMLLFIALANAGGVVFAAGEPGLDPTPHGWERGLNFAMMLLISGHAYPVFAVMFGYGLVQLSNRQRAAGASPARARDILVRRNAWLVVFGAAHGILLYFGDFLGAYGLVGIVAACILLNRGDRFHRVVVWLWGVMLVEFAVLGVLVVRGLAASEPADAAEISSIASLEASGYFESLLARLTEWPLHTASVVSFIFIVWLGMWGARRRVLEEPARHRGFLTAVAVAGLGIGIAGSIPQGLASAGLLAADESTHSLMLLLHNVGGMFAGPGYVAAFGLLALRLSRTAAAPTDSLVTGSLTALGRRSLSGYLFQSVAWLVLLLPFTLDLGSRLGNPTLVFIVVAALTWLATVIMASALERRGMPGPAEVLLRRLTYGPRDKRLRPLSGGWNTGGMRFRLLGPIEADVDGRRLDLGGGRQRAVLAVLLLHRGQLLSRPRLIELVWGDAPDSAPSNLRTYLVRLRKVLGDDRFQGDGSGMGITATEVDIDRFEALVSDGDGALACADPAGAAGHYGEALALWRGDPLAGAILDAPLRAIASELAERRDHVSHKRYEALIECGHHADCLGELHAAVSQNPLREHTVELLMRALHRDGRGEEALALFRDTRDRLADELGIEPGPSLARLQRRIRDADPELRARPPALARPRWIPVAQLPPEPSGFTGRREQVAAIIGYATVCESSGTLPVIAIEGMGGTGKTTLAVHAARRLAADFPDGQLFVELRGHDDERAPREPAEVLARVLRSVGVAAADIPEDVGDRAALFRSTLSGRRVLLVLDNASGAAQVRPLLPGDAGCLVLVTGRSTMADLDEAHSVPLSTLTLDEGVALFRAAVGDRLATESAAAAAELVDLCGRLPLALGVVAARLRSRPAWTLTDLRERLAAPERLWDELAAGDTSVAASFAMSYRELSLRARRVFRALGAHPGADFDAYAAAALAGLDDLGDVESILDELADANMLTAATGSRFRLHDLMRQYARSLLTTEDDGDAALLRLVRLYRHGAHRTNRLLAPGGSAAGTVPSVPTTPSAELRDTEAALAWDRAEHENLRATVAETDRRGWHEETWKLAFLLHTDDNRHDFRDLVEAIRLGVSAAKRLEDPDAELAMLHVLGTSLKHLNRFAEALSVQREVVRVRKERGDAGAARSMNILASVLSRTGDIPRALAAYREAAEQAKADGLPVVWATAAVNSIAHLTERGDTCSDVHKVLDELEALFDAHHHTRGVWFTRRTRGGVLHLTGDNEQALELLQGPLAHDMHFGNLISAAQTYTYIGRVQRSLGRIDDAIESHERMIDIGQYEGNSHVVCMGHQETGLDYLEYGDHVRAVPFLERARRSGERLGVRRELATTHRGLGDCLAAAGHLRQARIHWLRALELYRFMESPFVKTVEERLERA